MLKVHFLNVGHGDCTVIEHPSGRLTVVDIHNSDPEDHELSLAEVLYGKPAQQFSPGLLQGSGSLTDYLDGRWRPSLGTLSREASLDEQTTDPVQFLKTNCSGRTIFRYVQTHPDLDHMRGLSVLKAQGIEILNFWDTQHDKVPDFRDDADRREWQEYQRLRSSADSPKVLRLYRNAVGAYYNQDPEGVAGGDGLTILSPTPELVAAANATESWNNLSYVLMLSYKGVKIVLGGDAESVAWDAIVKAYGSSLSCNVLKASHHGRESGFHEVAVRFMKPYYTVVSVGKKPEEHDASDKYRVHTVQEGGVWSTRWKGNITVTVDDNGRWYITPQFNR